MWKPSMFGYGKNYKLKPVEYFTMCWTIITRVVCVYKREHKKGRRQLEAFQRWGVPTYGEGLVGKAWFFSIHSSSFSNQDKREETKWTCVTFLLKKDNGES